MPALEWERWLTPKNWIASLVAVSIVAVGVSAMVAKAYIAHHAKTTFDEAERIDACRTKMAALYKPQALDLNLAGNIHGLCYAEVNEEDLLGEMAIRRSAFLNQQAETAVLMWMVVGITLSGVALAGLQLVIGYKLASVGKADFDQGGELALENNRLSLKSSVTGLVILAISLAFFYIFVSQVYLIKEFRDTVPASAAGMPSTRTIWGRALSSTPSDTSTNNPPTTAPEKQQLGLLPGGLGTAPGGNAQPSKTPPANANGPN